MDSKRRAILTVATSTERNFAPYIDRFRRTLAPHSAGADILAWEGDWPPESPSHHECHYAFKVHAFKEARRRGYLSCLWLDCSCYAGRDLDPIWRIVETQGHFFAHGDDRLGTWSSDMSLAVFGVGRDEAMAIKLFSGTIIGLDFRNERARHFYDRLLSFANPTHFNGSHRMPWMGKGSLDPRCEGHRSDEVYMTLIARELGMASDGSFSIFSGGMGEQPTTVIQSGYNIPVTV